MAGYDTSRVRGADTTYGTQTGKPTRTSDGERVVALFTTSDTSIRGNSALAGFFPRRTFDF